MEPFRRIRLASSVTEASAITTVRSPGLLERLSASEAWWLAHDEAGLGSMVSLVRPAGVEHDSDWLVSTVRLHTAGDTPTLTDAESLAAADGFVFVFGSGFIGPKGTLDSRRSFVARFAETDVAFEDDDLSALAQVIDLEANMIRAVSSALREQGIDLLEPGRQVKKLMKKSAKGGADVEPDMVPINVEGTAFVGDALVLGLRWPVSSEGQPLIAVVDGARGVLTSPDWSAARLAACPVSIRALDAGGTPTRPAGIRGMSSSGPTAEDSMHIITGQTDRKLAANQTAAAPSRHLRIPNSTGTPEEIQTFEGYRKVEGLASRGSDGWIYVLDDEDTIVLLIDAGAPTG